MHALILIAALSAGKPSAPAPWAYVTPALVKVRPGAALEHQSAVALELGRNECQAAQVVVDAGAPLFEFNVNAETLKGPGGAELQVDLSREAFLDLQHASNSEGRAGPWPDILIPAVDPIAHEPRRAFPYDAPGNVPTVAYAEVCAPAGALPGRYRGEIVVSARHRAAVHFPVVVQVLHYTLPATSSLPNAFGFSGYAAVHAHHRSGEYDEVLKLSQRYATLALLHRISLFGMTLTPPPFHKGPKGLELDFREYDRELAPFLDGTALPSGARFTSTDVRAPLKLADADRTAYLHAMAEHLRQRGWLDRAFLYAPDEPTPEKFPQVNKVIAQAHQADPKLRVLVTASQQPGLERADIWTPLINCLFARPGAESCPHPAMLETYAAARTQGSRIWWYQSCMSHGCGPVTGELAKAFSGWPSYMVDHPAVLNRAMGVAAYRYGVEGELYYDTVDAYDKDPWQDVWRFDGNGDGTLFYPGTPEKIGGKTEVPLASLRLKQIRDGLQDYETLRLADQLGLGELAARTAAGLVRTPWQIERDPQAWIRARHALVTALDARAQASGTERISAGR